MTEYITPMLAWWEANEKSLRKMPPGDLGPIAFKAGFEAHNIGFQLTRIADALQPKEIPTPPITNFTQPILDEMKHFPFHIMCQSLSYGGFEIKPIAAFINKDDAAKAFDCIHKANFHTYFVTNAEGQKI